MRRARAPREIEAPRGAVTGRPHKRAPHGVSRGFAFDHASSKEASRAAMARHHLDVNTSVRHDALELDGCDPVLLSHLAANDRDTIVDENGISGERVSIATTRPPPPDFDGRVSVTRLRSFADVDGPAEARLPLDSGEEVTRPLPRATAVPWSTRTALRIAGRVTLRPPPPRHVPTAPPGDLVPGPSSSAPARRRKVGERDAIDWSSHGNARGVLRSGRPVAAQEGRLAWVAAIVGALLLVGGQSAIARAVRGPWTEGATAGDGARSRSDAVSMGALPRREPDAMHRPPMPAPLDATVAVAPGAASPPSATAPTSPAAPGRFDARAARRSLGEAATRAAACSDPVGGSATAAVTFVPDGRAATARVGGRYVGTTIARCIEEEMKGARVAPFAGAPITLLHVVRLPGAAH